MKISKKEFLILQINDSLFPIGSYSHSYGLETYIQKGIVHDEKTAERYLRMKLRYSFMYTDLLAVKLSYEAATKGDIYKLWKHPGFRRRFAVHQENWEVVL